MLRFRKLAILDHEQHTGRRDLEARRAFNILLAGGNPECPRCEGRIDQKGRCKCIPGQNDVEEQESHENHHQENVDEDRDEIDTQDGSPLSRRLF